MSEYPSESDLRMIRNWDIMEEGYQGLLEFIEGIWWGGDMGGFRWHGRWLQLHTFGWSGNEDIVHELRHKTKYFWGLFWRMETRGGHYYFELVPWMKNKESIEKKRSEEKTNCTAVQCTGEEKKT